MAATKSGKYLSSAARDLASRLLKAKGRELALALRDALPVDCSFVVVLGQGPTTALFSDGTREEAIARLREALAELEAA